ncbi:MAG: hypothetical protein OQK46_06345, partial [Gammaproteobacteria bacterium]|nr:hypothetical protein [Gammaproteobacteria bacterium]
MLSLLRDNTLQLDVTSSNMDLSISRARTMLQSSVNISITSASVSDNILEANVRLENNSGHKTPSGYPSRRMWLHFKVTDSNNNIIFESGKINSDGSIAGAINDVDQTQFEAHYDLINSADQVQIYEPVMVNSDDQITYTLLRGARYLKDNRLTPQGFNKLLVPADVAVLGQAANDANFNQGRDDITYRFPVAVSGDLNISVALHYQTIKHGFLQDLYRDIQLEQVKTFKAMYDARSIKHELITSAQTTVFNANAGANDSDNNTNDNDSTHDSDNTTADDVSNAESSAGSISIMSLIMFLFLSVSRLIFYKKNI